MKYRAEYDGHVNVTVTEDEAKIAFQMYAEDYGWSGEWEEQEAETQLDAAEVAARQNLHAIFRVIDTDVVDLEFGACKGVWRVEDEEE